MTDPLEQFRKLPVTSRKAEIDAKASNLPVEGIEEESLGYQACGGKGRSVGLQLRRKGKPQRSPRLAYLLDIVSDGEHGTLIELVFTFMAVRIEGRNLQTVIQLLENDSAGFIQEFDPKRWEKPPADAPVITAITLTTQEGSMMEQADEMESA
ncbi:MAG: hypothetical protein AAF591_20385 [Verrucomicrobiota bacterium]